MAKYTKWGFTLGQQFTIDGEDVMIIGFYEDKILYQLISQYPDEKGFFVHTQGYKEIMNDTLLALFEAYVEGLGAGSLSIKKPGEYYSGRNPYVMNTRQWENWNFGFNDSKQNELNKNDNRGNY